jgi:hypothetical protein
MLATFKLSKILRQRKPAELRTKFATLNLKIVILKLENVVILTLYLLAISKLGILSSPAPCSGSKELKLQQMVVT